jgi:hypothetical protein
MRIVLFIIIICIAKLLYAQDTTSVRVISVDSLKKYHIGIAKARASTIELAKKNEKP